MQFLDVKTDFAFKKVFGSPHSKDLLISFLNALLDVGDYPIVDLTIVDPYQIPLIEGMKDTFVDVKAVLSNGSQVINYLLFPNTKRRKNASQQIFRRNLSRDFAQGLLRLSQFFRKQFAVTCIRMKESHLQGSLSAL
jgi:PD-(D/E)XK nuclease family transposase